MPAPEKIQPTSLGDYLEIMTKAVFQSGISWRVVEAKWPGIKKPLRISILMLSPAFLNRSWKNWLKTPG